MLFVLSHKLIAMNKNNDLIVTSRIVIHNNDKLEEMQRNGFAVQLNKHTVFSTLKVNVNFDGYAAPSTPEEFINIVEYCRQENIPYFVVGNVSKSLPLSDVHSLLIDTRNMKGITIDSQEDNVTVQSGALLSSVASNTCKHSYTNFEFSYNLPGAVGASLRNDAQFPRLPFMIANVREALGHNINIRLRDIMLRASVLGGDGHIYSISRQAELANLPLEDFILEATFAISPSEKSVIVNNKSVIKYARMAQRFEGIDSIEMKRKVSQSLGYAFKVLPLHS